MQDRNLTASWLASLAAPKRDLFLESLTDLEADILLHDWPFWARPSQMPPGRDWRLWLLLAGRGFGKTRAGAEWVRARSAESGARIALVGATAADARDVMVEGESGILAVCPEWERPRWEPSKRRLTWPTGAIGTVYSADEPDRLRGPQFTSAWCDELAAWRYPEAWDMLMLGLRLGANPRCVVTTTPRPTALIRGLAARPDCVVTGGHTYENRANLAQGFVDHITQAYEGTRLARQEIYAEIIDDVPGALWRQDWIEACRCTKSPDLVRVVVAVDPPATAHQASAECGIVVAGMAENGHCYVLADRSLRGTPWVWGTRAVEAYHAFDADRIVAEVNQGGDMVEAILRQIDCAVSYRSVRAVLGKRVRAEPVAALYEQGRVSHVCAFVTLEDQMCTFGVEGAELGKTKSPDRLDALVWALSELAIRPRQEPRIRRV